MTPPPAEDPVLPRTRLFHDGPLAEGALVELDASAAHHATRVLRLRRGAVVELVNGDGRHYRAELVETGRDGVRARIAAALDGQAESALRIGLAQAVAAADRMDWLVEKAVELGVAEIQPLIAARCVVRLDAERAGRRLDHWRRVAVAACLQCGRDRVPGIAAPLPLAAWLAAAPAAPAARLLLSPRAGRRLSTVPAPASDTIWLMAGPEGGFTDEEEAHAAAAGWLPVRMGPRVLRTETAGAAAIAALQARFGDF